jgi:hypothetical protein
LRVAGGPLLAKPLLLLLLLLLLLSAPQCYHNL